MRFRLDIMSDGSNASYHEGYPVDVIGGATCIFPSVSFRKRIYLNETLVELGFVSADGNDFLLYK